MINDEIKAKDDAAKMKIAKAKAVEFEAKKKAEYSPHDGLIHKPYGNNQ